MRRDAENLAAEWKLQQVQYDRYELQSEYIKLGAMLLLSAAFLIETANPWLLAVPHVLLTGCYCLYILLG